MKKLVLFLIMIFTGIYTPFMFAGESDEAQYPEEIELDQPTTVIEEDDEDGAPGAFVAGVAVDELRRPYYGPAQFHGPIDSGVHRGTRPLGHGPIERGRGGGFRRGGFRRR